jgi:hypothetical protein
MSSLDERPLEKLADIIYNVAVQDLLEVWRVIRKRMDNEGPNAVRDAFKAAQQRFIDGPLSEHLEVRWGMNLCLLCNDDNIEKNGISYVQPSGDGLEFNQCLNCRVGILYQLVTAKATMDSYLIGLGSEGGFNGMSFYWVAIHPDSTSAFQPAYEVVNKGQWIGTVSFNGLFEPKYLPFDAMTASVARGAVEPWTTELPEDLKAAVDAFLAAAKEQVEVSFVIR